VNRLYGRSPFNSLNALIAQVTQVLCTKDEFDQMHHSAAHLQYPTNDTLTKIEISTDIHNGIIDLSKILRKPHKYFTPAEMEAITELIVEGPWDLPDQISLVDTPGFGDRSGSHSGFDQQKDQVTKDNVKAIIFVSSRIASTKEIQDMAEAGVFTTPTTLCSAYYARQSTDEETENARKIFASSILMSTLNENIKLSSMTIFERKQFFHDLANRALVLNPTILRDQKRRHQFWEILRNNSSKREIHDMLNTISCYLFSGLMVASKKKAPDLWKQEQKMFQTDFEIKDDFEEGIDFIIDAMDFLDLLRDPATFKKSNACSNLRSSIVGLVLDETTGLRPQLRDVLQSVVTFIFQKSDDIKDEDREQCQEIVTAKFFDSKRAKQQKDFTVKYFNEELSTLLSDELLMKSLQRLLSLQQDSSLGNELKLSNEEIVRERVGSWIKSICRKCWQAELQELEKVFNRLVFENMQKRAPKFKEVVQSTIREFRTEIKKIQSRFSSKPLNKKEYWTAREPILSSLSETVDLFNDLMLNQPSAPNNQSLPPVELKSASEDELVIVATLSASKPATLYLQLPPKAHQELPQYRSLSAELLLPTFVLSRVAEESEVAMLEFWNYLYLDGISSSGGKGCFFIVVEERQLSWYKNHLSRMSQQEPPQKNLASIYFVAIAGINLPSAKMFVNIAKLISEHFQFSWVWFMDHGLEETREWNRAIVGTVSASPERICLSVQGLLKQVEHYGRQIHYRH